jgi:hypothetical protein
VDEVLAAFVRSLRKSARHSLQQLNMSHTAVQKILRKTLKFESYICQLLKHITAQYKEVRYTIYYDPLSRLEEDENFTAKIVFSGEVTFNLSRNMK